MAEKNIVDAQRYNYWLNQSHSAIKRGYSSAISHYTQQKQQFLKELNITSNETIEEFFKELQNEMAGELESDNDILEAFDKGFDALAEMLENAIAQKFENGTSQNFEQLEKDLLNKKINKENVYKEYNSAKNVLTTYLEQDFALNRQDYLSFFNQATGFYTTDGAAADFIFGRARKMIYQKITTGKMQSVSLKAKNILKGYYKETIATEALVKVIQKYNKDFTAIQTGNVKNEKGESIIYDILIGKIINVTNKTNDELYNFSQQIEKIQNNSNDLVSETVDFIGTGAQSKSWVAPWDSKTPGKPNYYLEVAHRQDLKPIEEDAYYWHAGVYNAMSNMTSVIGLRQTLFFTGKKPYFTADLLSQFRNENYVLAFGMDKDTSDNNVNNKYKIIKNAIYFRLHNDK